MDETTAEGFMPTEEHEGGIYPINMRYLIIAPPKWGKTTFFSTIPQALMLCFEAGHMDVKCRKVVIDRWAPDVSHRGARKHPQTGLIHTSALEMIDALETKNPYPFIILDTIDALCKMAQDWSCARAKIEHPGDVPYKGWDLYQTMPFRKYYNRLMALGVGLGGTSHVQETFSDVTGNTIYRRKTSLAKGPELYAHTQADVIINGYFGQVQKGSRMRSRIASLDGTDQVMAGTRIRSVYIPRKYIVKCPDSDSPNAPWKQWTSFFADSPSEGQAAEKEYNDSITPTKKV